MGDLIDLKTRRIIPQRDLDIEDRMLRIKTSLEKINRLMAELKGMTHDEGRAESRPT